MNTTRCDRTPRRRARALPLCLLLAALPTAAFAADEEIQVYTDDATAPGQFGLDLHSNVALKGYTVPDYPGARPSNHVVRVTPEFYYGLAPGLELGAYLLFARDVAGDLHGDGIKLRLKYIAPHNATDGAYWGANLEVGRSDLAVAERPWNYELKGLWGLRRGPWLWAVNVDIDGSVSSHGGPAGLGLDLKVARDVGHETHVGFETYSDLGEVSSPGALRTRSHYVYAVADHDFRHFDLEVGLGRGLSGNADPWILKAIVGLQF
jgi:hypothetical protein